MNDTLDELQRKAEDSLTHSDNIGEGWFGERELRALLIVESSPDAAYIASASPDVMLRLIAVVRAAKAIDAELEPVKFKAGLFADLRESIADLESAWGKREERPK